MMMPVRRGGGRGDDRHDGAEPRAPALTAAAAERHASAIREPRASYGGRRSRPPLDRGRRIDKAGAVVMKLPESRRDDPV